MGTTYVPKGALVVLCGPPASGKTTWANQQIVNKAVSVNQVVFNQASGSREVANVDVLLKAGKTVVCDGLNIQPEHRQALLETAKRHNVQAFALRFVQPVEVLRQRNQNRAKPLDGNIIDAASTLMSTHLSEEKLTSEGFKTVEATSENVVLLPDSWDGRYLTGGIDVIGDVHGSAYTLQHLLEKLGYDREGNHKDGRLAVFVGDVCDKGMHNLEALETVMGMVHLEVLSNHSLRLRKVLSQALSQCRPEPTDELFQKALRDTEKTLNKRGLRETLQEIRNSDNCVELARKLIRHIDQLPTHVMLDEGNLAVCHAGGRSDMLGRPPTVGRAGRMVEQSFIYGPGTTVNENGDPVNWVDAYDSDTVLVHGHTVQEEPRRRGNVVSVDTGCWLGGGLTAYCWPENTFVGVETDERDRVQPSNVADTEETLADNTVSV